MDGSASQERMERGPFMVSQHHLQVLLAESKARAFSAPCPHLECGVPSVSPGWCAQCLRMPGEKGMTRKPSGLHSKSYVSMPVDPTAFPAPLFSSNFPRENWFFGGLGLKEACVLFLICPAAWSWLPSSRHPRPVSPLSFDTQTPP